jgi:hypothetical protein
MINESIPLLSFEMNIYIENDIDTKTQPKHIGCGFLNEKSKGN